MTDPDATSPSEAFARFVVAVAADLATSADLLNRLDSIAGDGDLGVTAGIAADALAAIEPEIAGLQTPEAVRRVGTELARRIPSTGGTLIAFAFMAAGKALAAQAAESPTRDDTLSLHDTLSLVAVAVRAAATSMATRGRVDPGDRTMLDALGPAADALELAIEADEGLAPAARRAAEAADAGARATESMRATVGRAGWLADRAQGHEDAGARLIALAFEAAARRLAK